ncbi:MAG: penicillin-binding transpeptidase domain-containing protein, partial [Clostridiales bacterium]|nr:penicillin-binding transpeptidase domain-containing protein [Clostridiales bacterium]
INGGFISIAREYKTRDSDGNLIVSAQFFVDRPNFFTESENGLTIASTGYALQQRVVQPQSAMVILDHQTGEIRAMVGGRQIIGRMLFNRADSPRQPGSSIKPIGVYAPALQLSVDALNNGRTIFPPSSDESVDHLYGQFWTAGSVIDDAPMTVGGRQWPRNWYNAFLGLSSMRVSIEQSINVAAVKVLNEITPEFSSQFLQRIGVSTIELSGSVNDINAAALALGGMTRGISPLEMAGAFGSIANRGAYVEPISYTKVTNRNGDILLQNIPITTQAMDPGVAFITQDMLRTNVTVGTNQQAAIGTQPVAGKTGTTNDNFDAWFVGFTPQYTASLWIGNDVNIQLSQGSVAASRLWSRIMRQVSEGLPTGQLASAPPNVISVTIDTTSGMLPSEISAFGHRGSRSEFFIRGTEPQEVDNVHVFVNVCTHSWHLATPLCPHTVAAFGVRRPYVPDPAVRDFRFEVPHFYCFVHNPDPNLYPINTNAPWEFDWEGRHHTQESEPELDPDELDEPDEPNDMPPIDDMPVNRDPDEDLGENVIDSNIYDDLPEFLRN